MAKAPLTTRIALEGGEEVIKMLRAMGAEGQAAADKLEKSFAQLGIGKSVEGNLSKLRTAFRSIQSASSTIGRSFANVSTSFEKVGQAAGRTRNRMLLFTAALTGAAYGFQRFVAGGLNALGQLQDLSESLNITAEDLQGFNAAAAQIGIDSGDFTKGIVGVNEALDELRESAKTGVGDGLGKSFSQVVTEGGKVVNIYRGIQGEGAKLEKSLLQIPDANGKMLSIYLDTADKTQDATTELSAKSQALVKIFKAMGVTLKKDMTNLDVLKVMARYFSTAKDEGELLGLSVDVFGPKLGVKMVRYLKQGEDALDGWKKTLAGVGALVTNEETALADNAGDKIAVLGVIFDGFRNKLVSKFSPAIIKAADAVMGYLENNKVAISNFIEQVGAGFSSIVNDIITLANGGSDGSVENKWLLSFRDGLLAAGAAAQYVFFDLLPTAFAKIMEYAKPVAEFMNSVFGTKLSAEGVIIVGVVLQLAGAFGVLFAALSAIGTVVVAVGTIVGLFGAIPAAIIAGLLAAGAAIYIFWDEIAAASKATWDGVTAVITTAWATIVSAFSAGNDAFVSAVLALRSTVAGIWRGLVDIIKGYWQSAVDYILGSISSISSRIQSIISAISSAISRAKQLVSSTRQSTSGSTGGGRGYAGGGYIRGPGSGTSDSIPAWLSNGEFVIRASAVRRYGADLFAALNGMRLSPNTLGRYAMGGLVGLPTVTMGALPAAAGPTSSLTLVLDNQQFAGLTGSADTIQRLERAIKLKRIRSTGRSNPYER